jgi:uncharacterized protein (DUF488 family)
VGSILYTVGHSNQTLDAFVAALEVYGINAVADVRSHPHSKTNPQFDRSVLGRALKSRRISYVFLGKELGARTIDPTCYVDGRVQYDALARTQLFQQGLKRIQQGMQTHNIAIMCAEKEPLACHRTILIARHLVERDICVKHILQNRQVEDHETTLNRLFRILKLDIRESHMFRTKDDLSLEAYRIQAKKIAYERNARTSPDKRSSGILLER